MLPQAISEIWNRISFGRTPAKLHRSLSEAAEIGDQNAVRFWLKQRSSDPNELDAYGYFPLLNATLGNKPEMVKQLLEAGAKVNLQGPHGYTALHAAAQNGFSEIVRILINSNAKVNIRNDDKDTALILATRQRHVECIHLISKAGGDPKLLGYSRQSSIEIARNEGLHCIADCLLKMSIDDTDELNNPKINSPTPNELTGKVFRKENLASYSDPINDDPLSSMMSSSMATYFIYGDYENGVDGSVHL